MVLLEILNGKQAGTSAVARRFPFRIGRADSCELSLDEPGVFEQHLELRLRRDRSVEAIVDDSALASINGQPVKEAILHSGDVLALGSVQFRFGLSPARQRSLRPREICTWIGLALLCLGQVALIYWLA